MAWPSEFDMLASSDSLHRIGRSPARMCAGTFFEVPARTPPVLRLLGGAYGPQDHPTPAFSRCWLQCARPVRGVLALSEPLYLGRLFWDALPETPHL